MHLHFPQRCMLAHWTTEMQRMKKHFMRGRHRICSMHMFDDISIISIIPSPLLLLFFSSHRRCFILRFRTISFHMLSPSFFPIHIHVLLNSYSNCNSSAHITMVFRLRMYGSSSSGMGGGPLPTVDNNEVQSVTSKMEVMFRWAISTTSFFYLCVCAMHHRIVLWLLICSVHPQICEICTFPQM